VLHWVNWVIIPHFMECLGDHQKRNCIVRTEQCGTIVVDGSLDVSVSHESIPQGLGKGCR
jgi:hypothetical protein